MLCKTKRSLFFATQRCAKMKNLPLVLCIMLALVACRPDKATPQGEKQTDSLALAPDTATTDSVSAPPKAADGLFDDFIYSFMRSSKFQRQRTAFPLPVITDGVEKTIGEKEWKHDKLYLKQDTYTLIFTSEKAAAAQKDTLLSHVVVEWVYLDKKRVKQYHFSKDSNKQWRLVRIEQHDMSQNPNNDFYDFYRRFSSSTDFQLKHIQNPFNFTTHDFDTFQTIEGLLDVEQWPDYRPNLPKGTITNINYGQKYGKAKRRVLLICSQSGGMGCSLTFVRERRGWVLEKLEN